MRNIQLVLSRWGAWARDDPGIDYSHIAAGFKGLLPGKRCCIEPCCDDDGLCIDSAVRRLKTARKPHELELILRHYVYGQSKSSIALTWKCSEREIRRQLQIVEGFIDGCLAVAGVTLEMDEIPQMHIDKKIIDKKILPRPEKNVVP